MPKREKGHLLQKFIGDTIWIRADIVHVAKKNQMRILYVTNAILANPDAPASRANGLSSALARRGIEVDLVGIAPALSQEIPGLRITALERKNIPRTKE